MRNNIKKVFYIAQVIFSVLVVTMCIGYGIRCLLGNQIFCAVCFSIMGYVCGYRLMFRASMAELHQFNTKEA